MTDKFDNPDYPVWRTLMQYAKQFTYGKSVKVGREFVEAQMYRWICTDCSMYREHNTLIYVL